MTASRRQSWRRWLIAGSVLAAGGLLLAPVTTRQGVDFTVSVHRLPLYLKAFEFMDRHYQYRDVARQVTAGLSSDRERVVRLFEWTRQQIRPTPPGFPVIDDHILHIIIRGYGQGDQVADVFTTLSTYAGVPAFWRVVKGGTKRARLVLCFARVDGRWAMFDIANDLIFADPEGQLLDVHQLIDHPDLVHATSHALAPGGVPYEQFVAQLKPFSVPQVLRAEKQMPLPRVAFEIRRVLHIVPAADPDVGMGAPDDEG